MGALPPLKQLERTHAGLAHITRMTHLGGYTLVQRRIRLETSSSDTRTMRLAPHETLEQKA